MVVDRFYFYRHETLKHARSDLPAAKWLIDNKKVKILKKMHIYCKTFLSLNLIEGSWICKGKYQLGFNFVNISFSTIMRGL